MADTEKHHHTKHDKEHHHHHKKEEHAKAGSPSTPQKEEPKKETVPAPHNEEEDAEEAKFNKENEAKRKAKQKEADKLTNEEKANLVLNSTEPPQPAATRTEALVPGTKAKMWKQDPEETNFGVSIVFIPELVKNGPADKEIKIVPPAGHEKVKPDENGDLCFVDPNKDIVEFEMVHCYCVARIILNMFERFFRQFDDDYILMWNWFSPSYIRICPRSGEGTLPVYSRKDKTIYCYEYESEGKKYSCVGFDLLAHEIGVAYLDGMKPDWTTNEKPEVQAIIQAFADLTTIFGLLTQLDVCELLLCETKGNLHKDNFVCLIGERFGKKNKNSSCLRNASNEFTYDPNCKDVSHLAQVLVGCIYDIIADFFVVYMDPSRYDAAESLVRVATWVRQMFFFAIWTCNDSEPTFKELSSRMLFYTLEKKWERSWVSVVKGELKERNMFWKEMEEVHAGKSRLERMQRLKKEMQKERKNALREAGTQDKEDDSILDIAATGEGQAILIPGSKMRMWKQDPSSDVIGISTVYIPSVVSDGPCDDQIHVVPPDGHELVKAGPNGDFFVDSEKDLEAFEMVHCYAVVRIVVNMYERFFRQFNPNFKLKWAFSEPEYLSIIPRAGKEPNAYYSREDKAIQLYYYNRKGNTYYTCHSFDLIAHECGHAILDGLRPDWICTDDVETISVHEAFADLTVVFSLLSQMDVVEVVLSDTKGNLHKDNFVSNLAEQFGASLTKKAALRNANNHLTMSQVKRECHELSQIMTGCIYDIIAELLEDYLNPDYYDTTDSLLRVTCWVRQMFMYAIYKSTGETVSFKELGTHFLEYAEISHWSDSWKKIIKDNLTEREIL